MKKNNETYLCNLCGRDLAKVREVSNRGTDEQYYRVVCT